MKRALQRDLDKIRTDIFVRPDADGFLAELIRGQSSTWAKTEALAAAGLARNQYGAMARVEALEIAGYYHVTFGQEVTP